MTGPPRFNKTHRSEAVAPAIGATTYISDALRLDGAKFGDLLRLVRPSEWLLVAYFSIVILRGHLAGIPPAALLPRYGLMAALAAFLILASRAEYRTGLRRWSMVRDWAMPPLLLVAYWAIDLPVSITFNNRLEHSLVGFDKLILHTWGVKAAIEYFGPVIPFLLEFCYCLLWAIPPVSIGMLYLYKKRKQVDQFCFILMFGVLTTYALMPLIPLRSPRILFPGQDLPSYVTPMRRMNVWLLNHGDIQTSVFPSGHVTTGFSTAYALLIVLAERKRIAGLVGLIAAAVAVATVYGRYHYAADGLAAMGVCLLACPAGAMLHRVLAQTIHDRGRI